MKWEDLDTDEKVERLAERVKDLALLLEGHKHLPDGTAVTVDITPYEKFCTELGQ